MYKLFFISAVLFAAPAFAQDSKKEEHAEHKRQKEVAKAEKRARKAVDWSFEKVDRPMPVCNLKGKDCEQ